MTTVKNRSLDRLIERHRLSLQPNPVGESEAPNKWLFENRISFSIVEFAARTGLSTKTVERMIKRGEIRAVRTGRRLLIPTSAIEAWLNQ